MSRQKPYTRAYPVNSNRTSKCGSETLPNLDWNNWITDGGILGAFYLRVQHKDALEGTWHRVHPHGPAASAMRIKALDGELYWLVDG